MKPVCELDEVSKSYSGRRIIESMSMTVLEGEMVAITGRSGSGKTTLLNILGLLESADSGTVRLFGQTSPGIRSRKANRILRNRLAYLFQNYALIDNETVDYNLRIAQTYLSASTSQRRQQRAETLRQVGLPAAGPRKIYELSGGEQQRVAIARILLKPCDLVLADEPTGSLDAANRTAILDMLRDLNKSGKAIVVVTHDEEVAAACHRVIDLDALRECAQEGRAQEGSAPPR